VPRGPAGGDDPLREQLSALRGLLVLSVLLTRQDDEAGILHLVVSAVESLGHCRTERIRLDGRWTEARVPQHEPSGGNLDGSIPPDGVRFDLAGVPWSWAYSMSSPRGPSGCLVVGAEQEPAEGRRFLLQVLAQQAGVALANARLPSARRERRSTPRSGPSDRAGGTGTAGSGRAAAAAGCPRRPAGGVRAVRRVPSVPGRAGSGRPWSR
jgi:hypothetical protein